MRPVGAYRFSAPEKFAELPQAPNGIAYSDEEDALFVSGDSSLWRISWKGRLPRWWMIYQEALAVGLGKS